MDIKEFLAEKTLYELMDLLIKYGRMEQVYISGDGYSAEEMEMIQDAEGKVKIEISNRVSGIA